MSKQPTRHQWEEAQLLTGQSLTLGSTPGHTMSPGHCGKLFKSDFFFKRNSDPYPDTESDSPYGVSAPHNMKHQRAMAVLVTEGHSWEECPGKDLLGP